MDRCAKCSKKLQAVEIGICFECGQYYPGLQQVALAKEFRSKTPSDSDFLTAVLDELTRASQKHPPLHSHHEAAAVIQEEFEEYWKIVKTQDRGTVTQRKMLEELIQIAAMAYRTAFDLIGST